MSCSSVAQPALASATLLAANLDQLWTAVPAFTEEAADAIRKTRRKYNQLNMAVLMGTFTGTLIESIGRMSSRSSLSSVDVADSVGAQLVSVSFVLPNLNNLKTTHNLDCGREAHEVIEHFRTFFGDRCSFESHSQDVLVYKAKQLGFRLKNSLSCVLDDSAAESTILGKRIDQLVDEIQHLIGVYAREPRLTSNFHQDQYYDNPD